MNKLKTYDDPVLDRQIQALCEWTNRPVIRKRGEGIILCTPDGTKQYRLSISNAGAIVISAI